MAGVLLVLQTATAVDVMSAVTKPVVVGTLGLLGWEARDAGVYLDIDYLRVPWTGDCAGLNILAVLLAVVLWTGRERRWDRRLAVRLVVAVPVAFVANLARIFSLIAYRFIQYPTVESPQLHYFIGFLWVLPVLGWFATPGPGGETGLKKRGWRRRWLEVLQVAAALALLAPLNSGAAGWVVAVCALALLLPQEATADDGRPPESLMHSLWFGSAIVVALTRMESLWLPWLLACPGLHPWVWKGLLFRVAAMLGTVPLLAWNPGIAVIAVSGAVCWVWRGLRRPDTSAVSTEAWRAWPRWGRWVAGGYLLFPFIATSLPAPERPPLPPPAGAMVRSLEAHAREVRLLGQSPELRMVWYDASSDGRHHTLEVCMRYRGVELEAVAGEVMTDGRYWYRQFFIQRGRILHNYRDYLLATSLPLSNPGTHIIVTGDRKFISLAQFVESIPTLLPNPSGAVAADY